MSHMILPLLLSGMKNLLFHKTLSFLFICAHHYRGVTGMTLKTSKDPLTVQLGGTVVIPCIVKTQVNINPKNTIIVWKHLNGTELSLVHYSYEGVNSLENQEPRYNDRTSLPDESKINNGNVSLILTAVRKHDEGKYRCEVDHAEESKEIWVLVKVSDTSPANALEDSMGRSPANSLRQGGLIAVTVTFTFLIYEVFLL